MDNNDNGIFIFVTSHKRPNCPELVGRSSNLMYLYLSSQLITLASNQSYSKLCFPTYNPPAKLKSLFSKNWK